MNLTYQVKGSTDTKEVRVEFDPPLLGYEEVKPRLMDMKGQAEEQLGMVRPSSFSHLNCARTTRSLLLSNPRPRTSVSSRARSRCRRAPRRSARRA